MAIYARDGRHFTVLSGPFKPGADDTNEICGVRLPGSPDLDIVNIYRPPIRSDAADERRDNFDPDYLPTGDIIVAGDVSAHPLWGLDCDGPDATGEKKAEWLDRTGWATLNDGRPTFTSYRSGGQSAPDATFCRPSLARRCKWSTGPDMGSDHITMFLEIQMGQSAPRRIRKTKWSFKRAAWLAFQESCEAALSEGGPEYETVQEMATTPNGLCRRGVPKPTPHTRRWPPGSAPPFSGPPSSASREGPEPSWTQSSRRLSKKTR